MIPVTPPSSTSTGSVAPVVSASAPPAMTWLTTLKTVRLLLLSLDNLLFPSPCHLSPTLIELCLLHTLIWSITDRQHLKLKPSLNQAHTLSVQGSIGLHVPYCNHCMYVYVQKWKWSAPCKQLPGLCVCPTGNLIDPQGSSSLKSYQLMVSCTLTHKPQYQA